MSGMVTVISLFTGARFDAVVIECEGRTNKPIAAYSKSSAAVSPLLASQPSILDLMIGAYYLRPASQVMLSPLLRSLLDGGLFRGIDIAWSVIIVGIYIYIDLQLCKMTDARASHINAKQGTIKAQNTIKQDQLKKGIKCPSDRVVGRLVQRMSQGSPWATK
jgi:hypothetical protein